MKHLDETNKLCLNLRTWQR